MGRPEGNIGDQVDAWLTEQSDVWFFNVWGNQFQKRGVPDRVGNVGPMAFYCELKKPGKNPEPIQRAIARKIRRAGGTVRTCRSLEEVQDLVEELRSMALDMVGATL